jgi:uncharacterized protein YnzC (UPF0291/DUF896 family)
MAGRTNKARKPANVPAENVENDQDNLPTPENEVNEMTEPTNAPDENVPENNVPEPDTSVDDNSDTGIPDDPETEKADVPDEPVKFDLPADPESLELSDTFATLFGQRILSTLGNIKEIDELLRAQESGDTEAAVVAYAESDKASESVQDIYGKYSALKAELTKLLDQMSAVVKTEKGEIQLTADELTEKKDLKKKYVTTVKNALVSFNQLMDDNNVGDDVRLFADTIQSMIGGRGPSKAQGGTGSYKQSTDIRPRINPKDGGEGYIQIGGENGPKFLSFTPAVKELRTRAHDNTITVGEVHAAWANAAGISDAGQWASIPRKSTANFTVKDVPVTVHFDYVK